MRPNLKVMYGLTHDLEGAPIVRVPKVVKVQIGVPKGPDIKVYIAVDGTWRVVYNTKVRAYAGRDRGAAEAIYRDLVKSANEGSFPMVMGGSEAEPKLVQGPKCVMRQFPAKLPYFTFSKQNGDGTYEPDWGAIEAHGHCPTEIEIVFVDNSPFEAQYQMWSASDLLCTGDGLNAERNAAKLPQGHEVAAAAALKENRKMFPIVNGCHMCGCPYGQPGVDNKGRPAAPACKPHGRLQFQLVSSLRLGGTAQFDTTSYRSVQQLSSCLHQFLAFTGNGNIERGWLAGIPLLLCLRKFKHSQGNAYAVSLEFRAESIAALRTKIIEAGSTFRAAIDMVPPAAAAAPAVRQITAGGALEARQMTSEFYDDLPEADGAPKGPDMQTATATRQDALAAKLAAAKAATAAPAGPVMEAEVITEDMIEDSEDENDANEDYDPSAPTPPAATDEQAPPTEEEMKAATIAADKADKDKEKKRRG